jgi:hypothetical protein
MRIAIALLSSILISLTAAAPTAPKERMTVVISLDGVPAHALDDPALPIPTLRALIRDGVSARMSTVGDLDEPHHDGDRGAPRRAWPPGQRLDRCDQHLAPR